MISSLGREGDEMSPETEESLSDYEIILKLTVRDVALLWRAAAQRLFSGGLEADDIDETIGPIDDPAIDDCLATLALPKSVDGCSLVDFNIHLRSWPSNGFGSDDRNPAMPPPGEAPWGDARALGASICL